jgi:hypothetical protein
MEVVRRSRSPPPAAARGRAARGRDRPPAALGDRAIGNVADDAVGDFFDLITGRSNTDNDGAVLTDRPIDAGLGLSFAKEHKKKGTTNPANLPKHEKGESRRSTDKDGERGDQRRVTYPNRRRK